MVPHAHAAYAFSRMSTTDTEAFRDALAQRYAMEREIGCGGSATVYHARDLRHYRPVALKVLNPDVGAALGVDRFLGEIRVTANLQHANILPLFDSGEIGGTLFYVMPLVEGESLRARIERDGAFAIDQAVRLISTICGAIDYAHRHGVVHRDIKPENILLSDGVPIVADFGIAKAIAASHKTTSALTQVGMSLGTPAYMSPEQAMGEPNLDGRSDVYALGCLLYEMLVGKPPFDGPSAHSVIVHHIMTPVPSVRGARESVPPVIDAANEDEYNVFAWQSKDASGYGLDLSGLRAKLEPRFGTDTAARIVETYQRSRPAASPTDIVVDVQSVTLMGVGSTEIAQKKTAQGGASVYLYDVGYKSESKVPGTDYPMGTPHRYCMRSDRRPTQIGNARCGRRSATADERRHA